MIPEDHNDNDIDAIDVVVDDIDDAIGDDAIDDDGDDDDDDDDDDTCDSVHDCTILIYKSIST
jgi:hypothetical protein